MHFANVFRRKKSRKKKFFSPFAPKLIPARRVRKSSLELRVAGKIRSVSLSEASFSGKCALKVWPSSFEESPETGQNGQNRQYRDLRPFGLRKIPMHFTNVFSGKKSQFGPKRPKSTVSGSPTLWIAKNPYAFP